MFQLFLHQETHGRFRYEFCDARCRCMRTVCRAKGVVHINIAEFRECFGKFRIIRFLFWLEPDVLKQSDIAVLHVVNDFFRNFPNRVVAENNGLMYERV